MQFLTLYPTNFTVLDEMLADSRYRTNPEVICINQDVPTCFYAVQRSRLPIIVMLLDRGLSDTNMGEVNQIDYTKFKIFCSFPPCLPSSLSHWSGDCRQFTRNSSHHFRYRVK